jgi:hypothetical protein
MIDKVADIRLDPAITITVEGVGFHKKGRDRRDRDDANILLCRGGKVVSFTVKGGREGGISGVSFGVGNGS